MVLISDPSGVTHDVVPRATSGGRSFQVAGYSADSLMATEMVHQLTALRMKPEHLYILDLARLPSTPAAQRAAADYKVAQIAAATRHMVGNPFLQEKWWGRPATVRATIQAAGQDQMRSYSGPNCIFSSHSCCPTCDRAVPVGKAWFLQTVPL
jgi:hypothetical protein